MGRDNSIRLLLPGSLLKDRVLFYIGLQGIERLFHDLPAQFLFFLRVKFRVSQGINNLGSRYYPVGTDHFGHRDDRTYMGGRQSGTL